jgi:hypothetical protein
MVIDTLALVAFLCLLSTGLTMRFTLPPGSPSRGLTLLGMDRHGWGDIHTWASWAFMGFVAVHLALHWAWVAAMTLGSSTALLARRRKGGLALAAAGAALLLAVALPLALPTESNAQPTAEPGIAQPQEGHGQHLGQGHGGGLGHRWR